MRILYFQSPERLEALSEACLCLTPKVFTPNPHELYLDIGETLKALGGEDAILASFEQLVAHLELQGQTVLTDRPEWARMFTSATRSHTLLPEGQSYAYLARLPIERLQDCGDPTERAQQEEIKKRQKLIDFMKRVGLRRVGDFMRLPPTAANRRFGKRGIALQSWLRGERPLCLPLFLPSETIQEKIDTDEIESLEALLLYLKKLLVKIEHRLCGRGVMASALKFKFHLEYSDPLEKTLSFSQPQRDASSLLKLTREMLSKLRWDSPLQQLELEVTDTLVHAPGQLSLFDKVENRRQDLESYVKRLRLRYGSQQVGFPVLQQSHLPERSWIPVARCPSHSTHSNPPSQSHRPVFLYSPPRPFHPSRNAKLIPSENLAAEWWAPSPGFRRYFVLCSPSHAEALWIFWDLKERQWYLHGAF